MSTISARARKLLKPTTSAKVQEAMSRRRSGQQGDAATAEDMAFTPAKTNQKKKTAAA